MGTVQLGHVDHVVALQWQECLALIGTGKNPSTGWKNWFEPTQEENNYEFKQETPDAVTAPVVLPFTIISLFPLMQGTKEIVIHEIIDHKPSKIKVPVRQASLLEESSLHSLALQSGTSVEHLKRTHGSGTSARRHLGTVDIPFGCADWQHPFRARRIDFFWLSKLLAPKMSSAPFLIV